MTDTPSDDRRSAARQRPADPAGTRPKVDLESLLPIDTTPLLLDGDAVEIDDDGQPLVGGESQHFESPAGSGEGAPGALVVAAARDPERPVRVVESPHAPRFQFGLGALLALGMSAIFLAVVAVHSNRDAVPLPWSKWVPTQSGYNGATQIANHVSAEYRLPSGHQMLVVSGGPPVIAGIPVTLAVSSQTTGNISAVGGNGVLFTMCGQGPSCSIAEGKPSAERLLLVRREALELALYTFHYIGADDVVVFLPPVVTRHVGPTGAVKYVKSKRNAVFYRAGDLTPELDRQLTATLTPTAPGVQNVAGWPDAQRVDQLTTQSFFKFTVQQSSQDGSVFLVLQPLPTT